MKTLPQTSARSEKFVTKDKVAIVIGNKLYAYRKGFVNHMSEKYDLSIFCTEDSVGNDSFHSIKCRNFSLLGFKFQFEPLRLLGKNDYKKVIVIGNLRCLSNFLLMLLLPKTKLITWGFWNTRNRFANLVRAFLSKRASANVLYAESHLESLAKLAPTARFEIGVNTVQVDSSKVRFDELTSIVLVGTLNERKRADIVVSMMPELLRCHEGLKFEIVGDGPCRASLEELVKSLGVADNVVFHGRSTDPEFLADLYSRAIVEVSPGQAGLSVPTAIGHGTPFATLANAISGGETDSIIEGYNGFVAQNPSDLSKRLGMLLSDKSLMRAMKENSLKYYNDNLTVSKMASGFERAISSQ